MSIRTSLIKRLRDRLHKYRLNLWLLEGHERKTGVDLGILYAGHLLNKNYIAYLAYGGKHRETPLGRAWIWSVPGIARSFPAASLVFIETEEGWFKRFGRENSFYIPCWIDGEIDITGGVDRLRVGESLGEDLRKIRKYKLQYEVTKDVNRFEDFYRNMYQPYITRVHGDRAALMSREAMMSRIDSLELLLIRCGEEYIAGEVLRYEGNGVRSWSLGVKDGDRRYLKQGAVGALYYYRRAYLAERGYRKYHTGATRAFLDDGVLQYKKKWGLTLTQPRPGGWWLRWDPDAEGSRAFLRGNPFIYREGGALRAGIFAAPEGHGGGDDNKYRIPGLMGSRFTSALN